VAVSRCLSLRGAGCLVAVARLLPGVWGHAGLRAGRCVGSGRPGPAGSATVVPAPTVSGRPQRRRGHEGLLGSVERRSRCRRVRRSQCRCEREGNADGGWLVGVVVGEVWLWDGEVPLRSVRCRPAGPTCGRSRARPWGCAPDPATAAEITRSGRAGPSAARRSTPRRGRGGCRDHSGAWRLTPRGGVWRARVGRPVVSRGGSSAAAQGEFVLYPGPASGRTQTVARQRHPPISIRHRADRHPLARPPRPAAMAPGPARRQGAVAGRHGTAGVPHRHPPCRTRAVGVLATVPQGC
jgi:hypothetical protein